MLKSEMVKVMDLGCGEKSKPVLLRYTVAVQSNESRPYDEDALKLISSIKGIPDLFSSIELRYEFVDACFSQLKRQKITIEMNGRAYYTFDSDKDLDLFLYFVRLFNDYEPQVEVHEQVIPHGMVRKTVETYQMRSAS